MRHGDKIIYSGYAGSIYEGRADIEELDFSNGMSLIGMKKIGSMKATPQKFKGVVESGGERMFEHTKLTINYTAKNNARLAAYVKRAELVASIQEHGNSSKGYMAAMELQKFDAAIEGIGQDEVDSIRVVPLIRQIRGKRPNIFNVEQGFTGVNVAKLNARTPEQDTRTGQVQASPLEKVDFDKLRYSEGRFNLKKNMHATLIPSESQKRADFNLMQLNSTDAMVSFARMRNGQGLQALSTVDGTLGNSPTFQINDPEATGTSAIPHGAFNVKKEILAIMQSFVDDNEAQITTTFWNPIDYERYTSNYNVGGKQGNSDVVVSGVLPLQGIPDVTAILDRAVPRGMFYALDSQSALKGEGPFETEFWREYSRDADAFVMRDYVQFLIPNPNRYGVKIQIDGTGTDAFVDDSEIDTDAKLQTYVKGSQDLLNKPATA